MAADRRRRRRRRSRRCRRPRHRRRHTSDSQGFRGTLLSLSWDSGAVSHTPIVTNAQQFSFRKFPRNAGCSVTRTLSPALPSAPISRLSYSTVLDNNLLICASNHGAFIILVSATATDPRRQTQSRLCLRKSLGRTPTPRRILPLPNARNSDDEPLLPHLSTK